MNEQWAAGLLEGEGCFSMHKRKGKDYYECAIHCEMTDEDVLLTLHKVLGEGTLSQRPPRNTRKRTWILSIQNQQGIRNVLNKILPYLHSRRTEKAKEMLDYLEDRYGS